MRPLYPSAHHDRFVHSLGVYYLASLAFHHIKKNTNPEYIKSVAKYVDTLMLEIDKNMGSKSPLKVAVLAALNIADELMQEKEEKNKIVTLADNSVERLINKIAGRIGHLET